MTALKPIENRRVRGVASQIYPLNEICAHPDCGEDTADPHHIFPRSSIGNASWFVEISSETRSEVLPHVIGLCREHHDAVEEHRAWIRLEEDGYVWYDRGGEDAIQVHGVEWEAMGLLDPQPARGEKARKRPHLKLRGDERRQRRRITLAVPDDWENGGELFDVMMEDIKLWMTEEEVWQRGGRIPNWEAIYAMWWDWQQIRKHTPTEEEAEAAAEAVG